MKATHEMGRMEYLLATVGIKRIRKMGIHAIVNEMPIGWIVARAFFKNRNGLIKSITLNNSLLSALSNMDEK